MSWILGEAGFPLCENQRMSGNSVLTGMSELLGNFSVCDGISFLCAFG